WCSWRRRGRQRRHRAGRRNRRFGYRRGLGCCGSRDARLSMRSGVRLGIDVGRARIGVARCDLHGMLATPVETVARGDGDVATIVAHARELDAVEVVVGLPLSLSGASTASTDDA